MLLRTKNGNNLYDMLSLLQKAIRRGKYRETAYAANEIESKYRGAMWSRLLVISAEDCYGAVTKEVMALKEKDDENPNNEFIGQAIAIMCKAFKSRDACYFSCNFILDSRCPRIISIPQDELKRYNVKFGNGEEDTSEFGEDGFGQLSLFGNEKKKVEVYPEMVFQIASLHKAIQHRDMDMLGYMIDQFRIERRKLLWDVYEDYVENFAKSNIMPEIQALRRADAFVNRNKKNGLKDEIFVAKAAMILMYDRDEMDVCSSEVVSLDELIDWSKYKVKPIETCVLEGGIIPEWVFDCHTIKGKRAGKTDWDMTVDEQAALHPKKYAYFDDASWLYTYQQDLRNGVIDDAGFEPIRKFAETHEVNPVKLIPYE